MNLAVRKFKTWQKQTALVFSANNANLPMLLRAMIKRYGWTIAETDYPLTRTLNQIERGEASLLIIDDDDHYPVPLILKQLLAHKIGSMTPTIVLCSTNNFRQQQLLSSLGPHEFIEKPLTPVKFIPVFERVLTKWSTGSLNALREAAWQRVTGNEKVGLQILMKLAQLPESAHLATPCLALYFRSQREFNTAEKVLLSALKNDARSLGIILSLVDLYMHAAMPKTALRFLHGIKNAFSDPRLLYVDMMQAHLMLNQVDQALAYLEEMSQTGFLVDIAKRFLPRLLFTEGHSEVFEHHLQNQVMTIKQYQKAWSKEAQKDLAG